MFLGSVYGEFLYREPEIPAGRPPDVLDGFNYFPNVSIYSEIDYTLNGSSVLAGTLVVSVPGYYVASWVSGGALNISRFCVLPAVSYISLHNSPVSAGYRSGFPVISADSVNLINKSDAFVKLVSNTPVFARVFDGELYRYTILCDRLYSAPVVRIDLAASVKIHVLPADSIVFTKTIC